MRLVFSLLVFAVLLSNTVLAEPVSRETALTVAKKWYQLKSEVVLSIKDIEISAEFCVLDQQNIDYYVFSFFGGGYVIVSADNAAIPIIAYSFSSSAPEEIKNPALQNFFDDLKNQFKWLRDEQIGNNETLHLWQEILNDEVPVYTERDVEPLLTTTWDQGCGYNGSCPAAAGGPCAHVYAGCVATAIGQVMNYWSYPASGEGSHGYTHPDYGALFVNFSNSTYNWNAMPDNNGNVDIADLLFDLGVALEMDYGAAGSGAYTGTWAEPNTVTILQDYFDYNPLVDYVTRESYSNSGWSLVIREQLDANQPVVYRGHGAAGGHAFVCDGYEGNDFFHYNWGWSGSYNGYFFANSLNPGGNSFNDDQGAVINIYPGGNSSPVVYNMPDQLINIGDTFPLIYLDILVHDAETPDNLIEWTITGNEELQVSIESRIVSISTPGPDWVGSETLTFRATDTVGAWDECVTSFTVLGPDEAHFTAVPETASFYEVIVYMAELDDMELVYGDEIGLFDGNLCVGRAVANNDWPLSVFAWEGDADLQIPGFTAGNPIHFRLWSWNSDRDEIADAEYLIGNGTFADGNNSEVALFAGNSCAYICGDNLSIPPGQEDLEYQIQMADLDAIVDDNFCDIDDDNLSCSGLSTAEDGFIVSQNADNLTIQPREDFFGTVTLLLSVYDGMCDTDFDLLWEILPVNDVPFVAQELEDISLQEDEVNSSIDLNLVFDDADEDVLIFSYNDSTVEHLTIEINAGIVTITPELNWNGTETVIFTADDGENIRDTVDEDLQVIVSSAQDCPYFCGEEFLIPASDEDTALIFTVNEFMALVNENFCDPDNDFIAYIDMVADVEGVIITRTMEELSIEAPADYNGEVILTLTVGDGICNVQADIEWLVNAVNDAPAVEICNLDNLPCGEVEDPLDFNSVLLQQGLELNLNDVEGDALSINWYIDGEIVFEQPAEIADCSFYLPEIDELLDHNLELYFEVSDGDLVYNENGAECLWILAYNDLPGLENIPEDFYLGPNYPNPFNPLTTIKFGLPHPADLELSIYNIMGQRIQVLQSGQITAGHHEISWDASGQSSGVYFAVFESQEFNQVAKLILVK
jgi:hypothetical protein